MRYFSFLFFFISSAAFSADYSWSGYTGGPSSFSSPSSMCQTWISYLNAGASGSPYTYVAAGLVQNSVTNYTCKVKYYYNGAWSGNSSHDTNRSGSTCPVGAIYNSATGVCDAPPPDIGKNCGEGTINGLTFPKIIDSNGNCTLLPNADISATCKSFAGETKLPRVFVRFSEDGTPVVPKIDSLGCETKQIVEATCKLPAARSSGGISLSPSGSYCRVAVSFTGNVTPGTVGSGGYGQGNPQTGNEGVCADDQDCTPPEQPKIEESQPCTYVYDAEGRKTCNSFNFKGEPGSMNCGTVNGGAYTCTPKVPKSNGIEIGTTVTEVANSNGTKTETKTDVATVTNCAGYNSCTTTQTTNKTVSIKDGNGNTQSTSSTCTGANCPSGSNPDGNGDGLGDCTGDSCSKDEEGNYVSGPKTPELEEQDTYAETTQKFINRAKASPLVSGISGISMPAGGSCNIGAAQTWFGSIDFSLFCQIAPQILAGLRYLFLAIWAWAAIRLFFTA